MFLNVLIDAEHILGVDNAIVVRILWSRVGNGFAALDKVVDAEHVLDVNSSVTIDIFTEIACNGCDG